METATTASRRYKRLLPGPIPRPDPEPAAPTDPLPVPTATPAVPAYVYDGPSDPAAHEASPEALQALADSRGVRGLEELSAAIATLDAEAIKASPSDPSRLRDILSRRRIYAARA